VTITLGADVEPVPWRSSLVQFAPTRGGGQQLVSTGTPPEMEADEDINTNGTSTPTSSPLSPITRARARQLHYQVSSFLSSCPLYLDNGNMHALVLLRYDGEDKKGRGFEWTGFGQQDSTNS
jgi:hypothetical protein